MKTSSSFSTILPHLRRNSGLLTAAAALLLMGVTAQAADITWTGGTAAYNTSTNWAGGNVPGGSDNAINDNGSNNVVQILTGVPDWSVWDIRAGNGGGTTGAFIQDGPTVNVGGWFRLGIGAGATGVYTFNSGVMNVNNSRLNVAEAGTGILNINGGTINFNSGNQYALADGPAGALGTVNQTAGTVNSAGELWLGNNKGNGVYNLSGGTLNIHNWVAIGRFGASGLMTMTGGTFTKDGNGNFLVGTGNGSVGELDQSGGTLTSQNQFLVPESGSCVGTYNLSLSGSLQAHDWIAIGRNGGTGNFNMSGGVVNKTGNGNLTIGSGGPGTLNQTGGIITNTTSQTFVGESANGNWNMNAGTNYLGQVIICVNNNVSGDLELNGGLLQASGINSSSLSYSILTLNGGVLRATGDNPTFISGLTIAQVGGGGAIIDSQGFNLTIPQALVDAGAGGGLTKNGSGTLVLTGLNNYPGPTVVNAGILKMGTSSSGGGSVVVADKAGFGPISQYANGQLNITSLTIGGANGGSLNFDLGSFGNPSSAPLNIANALTANGTITVNVAAAVVAAGTFPLMQYGSLSGTPNFVLGALPSGVVAHLDTAANTLELVVTSAGAPRWDGSATGQWDLGSNQDWYDLGTLMPTAYSDGKPVVFDDNASGTPNVNLTATVNPASINFNNQSLNYTLYGSGHITGTSGLNINGGGSVAILNSGGNNFTGPTFVDNGTLTVTNLANGGSPSAIGASSSSPTNLVLNHATFVYDGPTGSSDRGFTIGATNTVIDAEGNLSLGGHVTAAANVAGGGSALTKIGPGQLTLTGTGQNEFASIHNPGVQVANGTLVLDGSAGGQTNHSVNEFWVGSVNGTGGTVILTNTTLNVDNWLGLGRSSSENTTSTVALYNSTFRMGNCSLGYAAGISGYQGTQILSLSGNSALTNYGDLNLGESAGANVSVSIQGNSVFFSQNRGLLSMTANSTAQMTVANSGRVYINSGWFSVADGGGSASLVLKDNASFQNAGDFNVTDNGAATADVVVQDNASLTVNNLYVAKDNNASGVLTITNNGRVVSLNGLTMSQHWDGNAIVPNVAVVNLAGGSLAVNLVQGRNNLGTFNFNGGKLVARLPFAANFMFNLAAINVQSGGAFIDSDTNTISIAQPLLDAGGNGGLTKLGLGTLYLNGANTYTGPTVVSAGSLGGSGSVAGPVSVASGGRLVAGAGTIGAFTINGALSFAAGSSALVKVTPASNDQIVGLTGVSYGGALVVTNTSTTPLTAGTVFKLFDSATAGTGNFTSVTILPGGSGTFNPATGELTITAGPTFGFNSATRSGGNLIVTGSGGTAGAGYTVLTSPSVTAPMSSWTTNTAGIFDNSGNFSNAIPIDPAQPSRFFRVRIP